MKRLNVLLCLACITSANPAAYAAESLNRGVVAVPAINGGHLVTWRLFADDPQSIAFNVYSKSADESIQRLNEDPVTAATAFHVPADRIVAGSQYFVRPLLNGEEQGASKPAPVWAEGYLEIPIQPIEGYRPGDSSVADLDGDGELELVVQQSGQTHDNAHAGLTDEAILDAYEMDGTHLWRINLGKNIRDGEHYTQFMVYDLDGDGRAELACKTADGTRDGTGFVIGDPSKDWRTLDEGSRSFGRVLDGPEYLTVFDGSTGKALHTVDYVPNRHPINGWGGIGGNGGNDNYGNRVDRFLACVAYLDGEQPSLVMARGVYGRIVLAAWDLQGGHLKLRWVFDSGVSYPPYEFASPYSGMGGQSISVADVDNDGRDEIVYQAMVVDDNGEGLYSTGLRHGDSMHVANMYPDRPGLEIFTVQENEGSQEGFRTPGAAMRDARTGEILWSHSPGVDIYDAMAADIDPRHYGYETWTGPEDLRDSGGNVIGRSPRTTGFAIWWDGDRLRELLTTSRITKWDWENGREETIQRIAEHRRGRGRYPNLMGDLVGDWREEVIVPGPDNNTLRLYTTPHPTTHRMPTLLHDRQYRLALAWQNVVYNKPPHPSFYLGEDEPASP